MSILTQIFSNGAATLVDKVGQVLDDVITTKEEKINLQNEIRKAEMQFELEDKKLSIEDTGNARNREIQIAQSESATKLAKNVSPILAVSTVILTFFFFGMLIFADLSDKKENIIVYILGVLSAINAQIYSYYFGSSSSSLAKDKIIQNKLAN